MDLSYIAWFYDLLVNSGLTAYDAVRYVIAELGLPFILAHHADWISATQRFLWGGWR